MRKGVFIFFASIIFLFPISASADSPFFEFNPDDYDTQPLDVIFSDTPSEVFIPQNDYLNGFDVWLDNDGASGPATFTLLADDFPVVTKTVTIPRIVKTSGGQRFHVNTGQIPVSGGRKYSIRLTSTLPYLRLYYGTRTKYLAHNAPYQSEFYNGVAMLGTKETQYSFKFALYEGYETKIPILKNIATAIVSDEKVKLTFNADEPVDYQVSYGIRGQGFNQRVYYRSDYTFCVEGVDLCEIVMPVLPGNTYDYQLAVKDIWGNIAQSTGSFASAGRTLPTPTPSSTATGSQTPTPSIITDAIPPIISNVRTVKINSDSVEIAWETNEAADSAYLISFTTERLSIDSGNDTTFEMEHFMRTKPVLNPGTFYIATITSQDIANNPATASFTFKTAPANPIPTATPTGSATPVPSGQPSPTGSTQISATPTATPTGVQPTPTTTGLPPLLIQRTDDGATTVSWSIPSVLPSDGYRVDIIDPQGQLISKLLLPVGTQQLKLEKNEAAEENTVVVYANNDGVFEKVAKASKIIPTKGKKSKTENFFLVLPYILSGLMLIIFGAVIYLKYFRKNKTKTPPSSSRRDDNYRSNVTYPT